MSYLWGNSKCVKKTLRLTAPTRPPAVFYHSCFALALWETQSSIQKKGLELLNPVSIGNFSIYLQNTFVDVTITHDQNFEVLEKIWLKKYVQFW